MSDRLRQLSEYASVYMANTRQLATYRLAREWMEAGVDAIQAAQWASRGYLPSEAAGYIAAGRTPEEASQQEAAEAGLDEDDLREISEYATTEAAEIAAAGRVDALIRYRVRRLAEAGVLDLDVVDESNIDDD